VLLVCVGRLDSSFIKTKKETRVTFHPQSLAAELEILWCAGFQPQMLDRPLEEDRCSVSSGKNYRGLWACFLTECWHLASTDHSHIIATISEFSLKKPVVTIFVHGIPWKSSDRLVL